MSSSGIFRFVEDGIYRKNRQLVLVMKMQSIKIPEFPKLRGEEAIGALYDFVEELENLKNKELTEKQIAALTKFAWGLTASIEAERQLGALNIDIKEMRFADHVRKTIKKYMSQPFQINKDFRLWKLNR